MVQQIGDRLISVKEAAQILGISKRTLYNRTCPSAKHPFPVRRKKVGRSVRFRLSDVMKFIEDGSE